MPLIYNGTEISQVHSAYSWKGRILYNGTTLTKIIYNGVVIWQQQLWEPYIVSATYASDYILVQNLNDVAVTCYLSTTSGGTDISASIPVYSKSVAHEHTFSGLTPNTTYYLFMTGDNYVNSSIISWKTAMEQLTAPYIEYASTPIMVVKNYNSVVCTLYYSTTSGGTDHSQAVGSNGSSTVTGLSSGTTYYCFFRASGYLDSEIIRKTLT